MHTGDVLNVSMKLAQYQRLQDGYSMQPISISFLVAGNLTSTTEIWKMVVQNSCDAPHAIINVLRIQLLGKPQVIP